MPASTSTLSFNTADADVPIPDHSSNQVFTASTVLGTVMAEQISHNVVNESGSASALALADVAANQNDSSSAKNGNNGGILSTTIPTDTASLVTFDKSETISTLENEGYPSTSIETARTESASNAAEPSAGYVAEKVLEAPAGIALAESLNEKEHSGYSGLENGVYDVDEQEERAVGVVSPLDVSADPSVTSDTDLQNKEGQSQVGTNSVKKPATFSKVSATKTFLAKNASPATQATKSGAPIPAPVGAPAQPLAKPRLVAKSGSALQNVQKTTLGAKAAGGPDASKVWNKNRPVAPPPPKQFTDEELKQQYGIHLATRLQADEGGKESKWADIDDDDEEWQPETVVWMDGTKSTLTPSDPEPPQPEPAPQPPQRQPLNLLQRRQQDVTQEQPQPQPQLQQQPEQPPLQQPTRPTEGIKPILTVKRPADTGPPKTILKPGFAAQQAKQQSAAGAPVSEKPSLKAKSPAPAPSRSPWAALPPVDAVPLVNPPTQQLPSQPTVLPTQDARAYDPVQPSMPAREIAADTFDRSWREGEGERRELFNSANGRYEPAPEGRRSSLKPDSTLRKPAVLQRPTQSAASPAEPSAAFQARNNSQVDGTGSWGRRRGSSISQGSLPPGRRMSASTKSHELSLASERRGNATSVHDMHASPQSARAEPTRPTFPQQSAWDSQMPDRPEPDAASPPVPDAENPVVAQERIMREKRELAVKRRKEEEERLETEKQERLKARLTALEGAGKSRKEREAEAAATMTTATPATEKPTETPLVSSNPQSTASAAVKPAEVLPRTSPTLEAPPILPPALDQHPQTSLEENATSTLPSKSQPTSLPDRQVSSADQTQRQAPRSHLSPRASARAPFAQQSAPYRPPTSSYSSPGNRKPQPFGRSPLTSSDAFSPWGTTPSNGNVWGSSGIGNGTFEKASSFAPMPMSQQNSNLPPPPGMTRQPTSTHTSPPAHNPDSRSPSLQASQVAEQLRTFAPPGIDARPEATWGQSRSNGVSPAPGLGRQAHLPGPIGPPSRVQQHQPQQPGAPPQSVSTVAQWNSASRNLPHQNATDASAAELQQDDAPPRVPREERIKETFRQTSVNQSRLGGARKLERIEYTIHDGQGSRSVSAHSPAPPSAQTQPSGQISTASPLNDIHRPPSESTVRIPDGSLNPAHGGLLTQQSPIHPPTPQQRLPTRAGAVHFPAAPLAPVTGGEDSSPPPPETFSHPVNSGDGRPHVKLPPPPPVVKLPPSQQASSPPTTQPMHPTSVLMPHRPVQAWGPPSVAQPIVQNKDWQARFNGLFNRARIHTEVPPSPPRTPPKSQDASLAVAASSRAVMDDVATAASATVSLPQTKRLVSAEGFIIDDSDDVLSKPGIEPIFNEELSFGSLPQIQLPRHPVYVAPIDQAPANNLLKMSTNSKLQKAVAPQSVPEVHLLHLFSRHQLGVFVKIPHTRLNNRLIRHKTEASPAEKRHPSAPSVPDRKPSGRFPKSRGKDGGPASGPAPAPAPDSPMTPAVAHAGGGGRRSASTSKVSAPPPPPSSGSPAPPNVAAHGESGSAKKKAGWARPVKSRAASSVPTSQS